MGERLGSGFLKLEMAWLDTTGRGSSGGLLFHSVHSELELVLGTHRDLPGLLLYFGRALFLGHKILEKLWMH